MTDDPTREGDTGDTTPTAKPAQAKKPAPAKKPAAATAAAAKATETKPAAAKTAGTRAAATKAAEANATADAPKSTAKASVAKASPTKSTAAKPTAAKPAAGAKPAAAKTAAGTKPAAAKTAAAKPGVAKTTVTKASPDKASAATPKPTTAKPTTTAKPKSTTKVAASTTDAAPGDAEPLAEPASTVAAQAEPSGADVVADPKPEPTAAEPSASDIEHEPEPEPESDPDPTPDPEPDPNPTPDPTPEADPTAAAPAAPDVQWAPRTTTRKKPSWRTALGVSAAFLVTALLLSAGVVWWYALQGVTLPIFAGVQPSASASSAPITPEPTPEEPLTGTIDESAPVAVGPEGSVALNEVAYTANGNFFTITGLQRVDAQSPVDGSALGSMLQVTIAYSNISADDADLMAPIVTVTTGAERAPAQQVDALGSSPFAAWVGAGTVAQASYVFNVDDAQQADISVTVTYGAGETVTFWGDANLFGNGQAVAAVGAGASTDVPASSTEVEE